MTGRHAKQPSGESGRRRRPAWVWVVGAVLVIAAVVAGVIRIVANSSSNRIVDAGSRGSPTTTSAGSAADGSPYSGSSVAARPATSGPEAATSVPAAATSVVESPTAASSTQDGPTSQSTLGRPGTPTATVMPPPASQSSLTNATTRTPTAAPKVANYPDDTPAKVPGAAPCIALGMVSSLENQNLVRAAAAAYTAAPRSINGHCVQTTVTAQRTGVAAAAAASGFAKLKADQRPMLWLPDSAAWLATARAAGGPGATVVPSAGTIFARSAVLVAMPQNMAAAIGWQDKPPTWRQVFDTAADRDAWAKAGHPEWGTFRFGKTSPLVATSGIFGMLAEYGSADGVAGPVVPADFTERSTAAAVKKDELATSHYMATPEHFLWHARQAEDAGSVAEFLSAVVVDEKSVWDYNRGLSSNDGITVEARTPPKQKLVPIYPTDGVYQANDVAAVLNGTWLSADQQAAAADFTRFLLTKQSQDLVRANGFRDIGGIAAPGPSAVGGFAPTVNSVADPAGEIVTAVQKSFPDVRKRARVLFLMDVSRSMSGPVATGGSKLDAAKEAVGKSLGYFAPDDQVGLAGFSNLQGAGITPGTVAPIAPLNASRGTFTTALANLATVSQTPLYDAVDKFSAEVAAGYNPDMINAVVLLSDGRNDTSADGTAATMTEHLEALHHKSPVLVFTLAFGSDADTEALKGIAKSTGAHYYDATDPTTISDVLGDLVTSF